jgi:predicted nucleotidyltransferase
MCPEVRGLLQEFRKRIPEAVRPHVRQLTLFGSVARGEDQPESDVDVLVLLDEKSQEREEALREAAYQAMWTCDFQRLLSLKILSLTEYEDRLAKGYSFYQNVEREGVSLWDKMPEKPPRVARTATEI